MPPGLMSGLGLGFVGKPAGTRLRPSCAGLSARAPERSVSQCARGCLKRALFGPFVCLRPPGRRMRPTAWRSAALSSLIPGSNRAARNPARRRHRAHPAATQRQRLMDHKQPPRPLIQQRPDPQKPSGKVAEIDHTRKISTSPRRPYQYRDSFIALFGHSDSIITRQILRRI